MDYLGVFNLKQKLLKGDYTFMSDVLNVVERNKVLYSDNCGNISKQEKASVSLLPSFMELLYRGSKHSKTEMCENGFSRYILYNDVKLWFTFFSGPDTFVKVEKVEGTSTPKKIITLDLLRTRLTEAECVKNELTPIIEKYLRAGLTFEEITRMFVEIMRENKINL